MNCSNWFVSGACVHRMLLWCLCKAIFLSWEEILPRDMDSIFWCGSHFLSGFSATVVGNPKSWVAILINLWPDSFVILLFRKFWFSWNHKVTTLPKIWTMRPPLWGHEQVVVESLTSLLTLRLDLVFDSVNPILASFVSRPQYFFNALYPFWAPKIFSVASRRALNPTRATCGIFLVVRIHYIISVSIYYLLLQNFTFSLF